MACRKEAPDRAGAGSWKMCIRDSLPPVHTTGAAHFVFEGRTALLQGFYNSTDRHHRDPLDAVSYTHLDVYKRQVIDMVLAIAFFVKLGTAYFDYRKSGQFEWTAPAILFACLVFTLTAPTYIWGIVGL